MACRLAKLILLVMVLLSSGLLGCSTDTSEFELDQIAVKFENGQFQAAEQELNAFVKKYPDNNLAWTILGHAQKEADKDDEAKSSYKRALEIDPKTVEAITGLGILARRAGNNQEALKHYENAVSIDPTYAQAYSSMLVICLKLSQYERAVELGEKAIKYDQEDPALFANLAVAYHYNGQHEKRKTAAAKAKALGYRKMDKLEKIFSGEYAL